MLARWTLSFAGFSSLVVCVSLIVSAFLVIGAILIVCVSLIIGALLIFRPPPVCVLARIRGWGCDPWLSLRSRWTWRLAPGATGKK
ncbi:MAG: hypothetical protein WA789_19985 [Candidatus Acidiferrum sp.]